METLEGALLVIEANGARGASVRFDFEREDPARYMGARDVDPWLASIVRIDLALRGGSGLLSPNPQFEINLHPVPSLEGLSV